MPIHSGKDSKGPFIQWGKRTKYHYKANDKQSLANAKYKAKQQMKAIFASGYVGQDIETVIDIEQIKNKLLKIFHKDTWEEFIDSQRFGDCHKITCYVAQLFPDIQIIEAVETFCPDAINALADNKQMTATHYFNKINGKFYDFGKGTNTINNIYLIGTEEQKYNVELEQNEISCFSNLIQRAVWSKYELKQSKFDVIYQKIMKQA